jgi:hypothetical protein
MSDDDWTPREADRLRAARVDGVPPPGLEEATVAALRERGLLRPPHRRLAAAVALVAMAAALVAVAAWSVLHRSTPAAPQVATAPASTRFVLLLYAGVDPVAGTPDTRRREYSQWARDLAAAGTVISGEELAEESRELPGSSAPPALPLPRGFFIVSAPDLAAAERIASTCPHLRYGGRIVVKGIAP